MIACLRRSSRVARRAPGPVPDVCIAVDWSGALASVRRRMWLAESRAGGIVRVERGRDRDELVDHLVACAERDPSLVVGLDFAFSFPRWFLVRHGLACARELWELVGRRGERWLARCPRPFWGRPGAARPPVDPERDAWRRTESESILVRGVGPKSVFQIGGAGSVGTGSLRGMPYLALLQDKGFSIWPFDRARLPMVVEIYPRYLTGAVNKSSRAARELHLQAHHASEPRAILERAAFSEDAFDAAVSAASMRRYADDFGRIDRRRTAIDRLEGRIWRPLRDPVFERW
jgi:hypothetical protein